MSFDDSLFASMANMQLADELYIRFCDDPESVDANWRRFFVEIDSSPDEAILSFGGGRPAAAPTEQKAAPAPRKQMPVAYDEPPTGPSTEAPKAAVTTTATGAEPEVREVSSSDIRVFSLIHAYRKYGHLLAKVNPISTKKVTTAPPLDLKKLGFSEEERSAYFPTVGLLKKEYASLDEIIAVLKEIYCRSIGIEYMDLGHPEMESWLQERIEPSRFKVELTIEQKQMILQQLNKSELFESFLNTKFVGQKRFSLEGAETFVPIVMDLIESGADLGITEVVLGMAHRGRLNVLTNILNKSYAEIFNEFEESYVPDSFEGSGDVKYHKGYTSEIMTAKGHPVKLTLADNPSHLEAVNGVVEGIVRAKQVACDDDIEMKKILPVLIHGDASISGQGVIYECLQFCNLPGYATGGSIHIVINNQIGFTTLPKDSRSTKYCTDISKAFSAPVFHVNGEDPEGCIYATNLAIQLRQKFHCDVFIDLNCYRKYGHNEGDEPAFTQPLEYQIIRKKSPIREVYRDSLVQHGVLEKYMAEVLEEEHKTAMQNALKGVKGFQTGKKTKESPTGDTKPRIFNVFDEVNTAVPTKTLKKMSAIFCSIPEGFNAHRKIGRLMKKRLEMVDGKLSDKIGYE